MSTEVLFINIKSQTYIISMCIYIEREREENKVIFLLKRISRRSCMSECAATLYPW